MRTNKALKIGIGLTLLVVIGLVSFSSFAHKNKIASFTELENEITSVDSIRNSEFDDANVSVTIDNQTTDDQIDEIVNLLKENNITPTLTDIKRNDEGKIIRIKIVLKDVNGNQTSSQINSNVPISQIVFGRKDSLLFITQNTKDIGAFAFFNRPNMIPFGFENDSIFKDPFSGFGNFNFDKFFNNDEQGSFFMNGKSMNLEELKEQMKNFNDLMGNQNFSWFFDNENNPNNGQKFKFYDDPNTNKLIIIDGTESDFKTLDELAKSNKLKAVDDLKPATAMSLYGNKGKDGAIIATTR